MEDVEPNIMSLYVGGSILVRPQRKASTISQIEIVVFIVNCYRQWIGHMLLVGSY